MTTPNPTHPAPEWLDYWGGLHTLDDGHEGSYEHEATARHTDETVSLVCDCGWSVASPVAAAEPADLLGQWEAHVYAATGRWQAKDAESVDVGHLILDELDESRAEAERLRAELAAEREQATRAARDGLERIRSLKAERDHYVALLDVAVARLAEGGSV